MNKYFAIILELSKIRITFFVTLSTLFGYIYCSKRLDFVGIIASTGIFLLASCSAVINHIQERDKDKLMKRTRLRPLPNNTFSTKGAVLLAVIYFLTGSFLLLFFADLISFILGLLSLIIYNAVYTPLKQRHYLAVIPGSLIGALPPLAGWTAAGGNLFDIPALLIAFFFFIWQIPHFWLLLLLYRSDYENAGFPTILQKLSENSLRQIIYSGIIITGVSGIIIPVLSLNHHSATIVSITLSFLWLAYKTSSLMNRELAGNAVRALFKQINFYVLFVALSLSIDKLTGMF